MSGKAFLLGDNISGDLIASGALIASGKPVDEMANYLFFDCRKDFATEFKAGDVIVAGRNFGCGSSREVVVQLMKIAGVKFVIAKSFGRAFYRNALNSCIFPIECEGMINDGDSVEVNLANCTVSVNGTAEYRFRPFPKQILSYAEEGGILEYYRKYHTL